MAGFQQMGGEEVPKVTRALIWPAKNREREETG